MVNLRKKLLMVMILLLHVWCNTASNMNFIVIWSNEGLCVIRPFTVTAFAYEYFFYLSVVLLAFRWEKKNKRGSFDFLVVEERWGTKTKMTNRVKLDDDGFKKSGRERDARFQHAKKTRLETVVVPAIINEETGKWMKMSALSRI